MINQNTIAIVAPILTAPFKVEALNNGVANFKDSLGSLQTPADDSRDVQLIDSKDNNLLDNHVENARNHVENASNHVSNNNISETLSTHEILRVSHVSHQAPRLHAGYMLQQSVGPNNPAFDSNGKYEIEVKAHKSGADEQLESFPWLLIANASLSYNMSSRHFESYSIRTPIRVDLINILLRKHVAPENRHYTSPTLGFNQLVASNIGSTLQPTPIIEQKTTSALHHAYEARVSMALQQIVWLQKNMNFISHDDAVTIWIRDFKLTSADTNKLISSLISHSMHNEYKLQRIVMNGHELWKSNTFNTKLNRGMDYAC